MQNIFFKSCPLYTDQRTDRISSISVHTMVSLQIVLYGNGMLSFHTNSATLKTVQKYIKDTKIFWCWIVIVVTMLTSKPPSEIHSWLSFLNIIFVKFYLFMVIIYYSLLLLLFAEFPSLYCFVSGVFVCVRECVLCCFVWLVSVTSLSLHPNVCFSKFPVLLHSYENYTRLHSISTILTDSCNM